MHLIQLCIEETCMNDFSTLMIITINAIRRLIRCRFGHAIDESAHQRGGSDRFSG